MLIKLNTCVILAGLILSLCLPVKSLAQYYSTGEIKKQIVVDKKLRPISNDKFFDNIDKAEKVFFENNEIDFLITVTNTGNQNLSKLYLTDYIPANLSILFNPGKVEDNKIKWEINSLGVGESKSFTIRTRIGKINSDLTTVRTNRVRVESDGVADEDTASFFVVGKSIPSTGNEMIILQSMLALGGIGMSVAIRKIARGY